MTKKDPQTLRSARWFAPDDLRSFGHRSRMMQLGYDEDLYPMESRSFTMSIHSP